VSKLTASQAMYHYISGYTAKVAGTEMGVTEPQATFSPCFGGPFLVWKPARYAELLAEKMKQHQATPPHLAREQKDTTTTIATTETMKHPSNNQLNWQVCSARPARSNENPSLELQRSGETLCN
jgi:hypothetical protein